MSQYYDLIAYLVIMGFYLVMAAIYDRHGTMVPDYVTFPYALLGLFVGALQGRFLTVVVGTVLFIMAFIGYCPDWVTRLNRWLIKRAYKTEEAVQAEMESYDAMAFDFEKRHGKTMRAIAEVLIILTFAIVGIKTIMYFIFGSSMGVEASIGKELLGLLFIAVWTLFSSCGMLPWNDARQYAQVPEEIEELSAFGGADVIIFIGFLGAYGLVGFIYGMIPTAIVYIIACVIRHIKTKNDLGHGQPLIPSILVSAPARIAMFLMLAQPMSSLLAWANPVWNLF